MRAGNIRTNDVIQSFKGGVAPLLTRFFMFIA